MPSNKNALIRIQKLDEMLSDQYHHYNLDDLTDGVNDVLAEMGIAEVTRRCIEKDISYIEYEGPFLEAEIKRYSIDSFDKETMTPCVKRCLKYEDPSYSIFKKKLTDDEKYLLSEALQIIGQFDGLPDFSALDSLKKSLKVQGHEQIVRFAKNPINDNSDHFGKLFTAISQKYPIELHYHTFYDEDNVKMIVFHPYLLKEYNRRWYVIGAAEDNKILNFCLDRIDDIIPLLSLPYKECKEDLEEWFDDVIGVSVYENNPVHDIKFWVSEAQKGYIENKPMHDSFTKINSEEADLRKKYPNLGAGSFYRIRCKENYELIRELCSYGSDLVVVYPEEIREKVKTHINKMFNNYYEHRVHD